MKNKNQMWYILGGVALLAIFFTMKSPTGGTQSLVAPTNCMAPPNWELELQIDNGWNDVVIGQKNDAVTGYSEPDINRGYDVLLTNPGDINQPIGYMAKTNKLFTKETSGFTGLDRNYWQGVVVVIGEDQDKTLRWGQVSPQHELIMHYWTDTIDGTIDMREVNSVSFGDSREFGHFEITSCYKPAGSGSPIFRKPSVYRS